MKEVHTAVAIFIDRQTLKSPDSDNITGNLFPKGILVPFIGGPGDRAALQLAIRFRCQSKLRLLVLRFIVAGQTCDQLDADLLDSVKAFGVSDGVLIHYLEVGNDRFSPVKEYLNAENGAIDLVLLGHSVNSPNTEIVKKKSDANPYGEIKFRPKKPSIRHSHHPKTPGISVAEEILGCLGELLFLMPEGPSLLVVHPQVDNVDGQPVYINGNHLVP